MWLRISSGRDSFPRLGWLGLALVVVWALPGTTQELSEPQIAAAFEGPRPALDVGDWTPPRELAESIRSAVARGWTLDADAVVIEWQEPDASIEGFREPSRLLGPGRGGSWIALLIDDDRRASLRFRAGIRVPTPLATADFPRAHTLGAFDIEWQDVVAWGAPEEVDTRSREGWITRRPIAAGEPLLPPLVSPRPAVTSGKIGRAHV